MFTGQVLWTEHFTNITHWILTLGSKDCPSLTDKEIENHPIPSHPEVNCRKPLPQPHSDRACKGNINSVSGSGPSRSDVVSPHCSLWHLVKGVPRQGAKERTSGGCELVCSGYHSKKADIYFLTGLEAGSPRSRCQHGWVLESSLPLGCRWPATLLLCPCMTSSLCSGGEGVSSPLSLLRDLPLCPD